MPHIDWFKSLLRADLTIALFPGVDYPRLSRLVLLEAPTGKDLGRWRGSPEETAGALVRMALGKPQHEFLVVVDPNDYWGLTMRRVGLPGVNLTIGLRATTQSEVQACLMVAYALEERGGSAVLILDPVERILLSDRRIFKGVWVRHRPGSPKPYPLISDLEADLAIDGVPYWIDHSTTHHTDGNFFSIFDKDSK